MGRGKRWIAFVLAYLCMLSTVVSFAAETETAQTNFEAALQTGTVPDILEVFSAIAAAEGDPLENLEDARRYAAEHGLSREFSVWLNGSLAGENGSTAVLDGYSSYRLGNGTRMNEVYGGLPEEISKALASESARRVGAPSLWTNERFLDRFGVSMAEFRPSSPYGGFCLVTASEKAFGSPTHPYTESDKALSDLIGDVKEGVYDAIEKTMLSEGLYFSGNPDTASVFLEVDIRYPFYSYYGNKSYSGYDTDVTVTALDAMTRSEIAVLNGHSRLGNTVSVSGTSGKVWAKFPAFGETEVRDFARSIYTACESRIRLENDGTTVRDALENALSELADKCTDPWQKAILMSGPEPVSAEGEAVTFRLCAFDPGLTGLRDLAEDPSAYLKAVSENAAEHSLEISAVLEGDRFSAKSASAVLAAAKGAAGKAKKAFSDKSVLNALRSCYFPQPAGSVRKAEDLLTAGIVLPDNGLLDRFDVRALSVLFYGSTKFALDTSGGPDALILTATGLSPEDILKGAAEAVVSRYAKVSYSNRTPLDAITDEYLLEIAGRCIKNRKNGKEKVTIPLRALDMKESGFGEEYFAYLDRFGFSNGLESLAEEVAGLPDLAALDLPKNGIMAGGSSGTKVILKAPSDGKARYVQIRRSRDDRLTATLFIRSGKSVSFKAKQGDYYALIASGLTWYGEDALFGAETGMSRTYDFDVPSTKYQLTITLTPVSGGNLGLRGADASMFHK